MTVPLFAGNQLQDFLFHGTAVEVTTAGKFDSAWVPNALSVPPTAPLLTPTFASQTDIWLHFVSNVSNSSSPYQALGAAYNSGGTPVVRLIAISFSNPVQTLALQWWNGSAWIQLGTGPATINVSYQNDIHIVIAGGASTITWYQNKIQLVTATGNFSSITNVNQFGVAALGNSASFFSEIIVHTVSTINRRYNLRLPSANGANTGFTGAYTDVNPAVTNLANFIYTAAAGNISTFPTAGKDLTGYAVDCVIVTNVSLVDVTGPQHEQWCLRVGGTNYFSGIDVAVASGWTSYRDYLVNNPATGVGWLPADAGSGTLEAGLKATA